MLDELEDVLLIWGQNDSLELPSLFRTDSPFYQKMGEKKKNKTKKLIYVNNILLFVTALKLL